jgi:hypothetical protein
MRLTEQPTGREAGERPVADGPAARHDARRLTSALAAGSAVALFAELWMLLGGHGSLTYDAGHLGSFFDVQGRALLDGHLSVPPAKVSIEGFVMDDGTYIYFGPVPALLRLPVLLVTHSLDGRLTQLSMLLAFVVLLAATANLQWRLRSLVRPHAPVDRVDLAVAFLLQVAVGAGSVALFLGSWLVVYHETELWGTALAMAAVAAVVGVVMRASPRRILWAGLLATLAVNARVSVGLGPVIALAILGVAVAGAWLADARPGHRLSRLGEWLGTFGPLAGPQRRGATLALLAVAVAMPIGCYAAINYAKFEQPFGIPIERQVNSHIDPVQRAALAANGGSLFGLKYVPTTFLQSVRPDAVGLARGFPWVSVPRHAPHVVGGARFLEVQRSLSAPTSMPLLCLLTLAGAVGMVGRRRLRPLIGVAIGTAAGFAAALAIAFVTTRYLADLLPFLVVGAIVGVHTLLSSRLGRRRRLLVGSMAVLTLAGFAVNGSFSVLFQRLIRPQDISERASFVRFQDRVDRLLARAPRGITTGAALPDGTRRPAGDLFVLGRCAGLFVTDIDGEWIPLERTELGGLHRLTVRLPRTTASGGEALLSVGRGTGRTVAAVRGAGRAFRFGLGIGRGGIAWSRPLRVDPRRPARIVLSVDRFRGQFAVLRVEGRTAVALTAPGAAAGRGVLGAAPGDRRLHPFTGRIARVPSAAPVCRRVAGRAGLLS